MDHLEHLAECEVCENADDRVLAANTLLYAEDEMLVDEGMYKAQLSQLWLNELKHNELISEAVDETAKYYSPDTELFDQDDLPPRPDEL